MACSCRSPSGPADYSDRSRLRYSIPSSWPEPRHRSNADSSRSSRPDWSRRRGRTRNPEDSKQLPVIAVVIENAGRFRRAAGELGQQAGKGIRRLGGRRIGVGEAMLRQVFQVRTCAFRDTNLKVHGMETVNAHEQHMFYLTSANAGVDWKPIEKKAGRQRRPRQDSCQNFHSLPPRRWKLAGGSARGPNPAGVKKAPRSPCISSPPKMLIPLIGAIYRRLCDISATVKVNFTASRSS